MQNTTSKSMDKKIEAIAEILADKLIEEIRKRVLEKETLRRKSEAA
ncbi:hypothetical protein [Leptospira borgpetersenii]|uniref:Uncharacterized protein n=5 Tax=Leptospira TaxID=171 RepID=M3FIC6_9LEPT|nr:hypothetical protein [Leptospira borgpetersenii]ANH01835.1 Uncharacterized protein LB4E_2616 [Leptospira borgpetersenii str. 4E]AXX15011.1 hypothetical protein C4Q31_05105 [Leptospira borgpetersenii serovar Ceylonica]EKQ99586.1 hypothetical protein LEP1GSC121_1971 [Leptospira borgpetersenii serovar Castellonis str. 200801910]EMF80217.1 hypothetical protein LEP1GSC188_2586 [Leptospira weilii serovar Topaz str. LT2116]EMO09283.1 hypothetical protein LEP1GSC137_2684 [Leptospira borgpetersenii 